LWRGSSLEVLLEKEAGMRDVPGKKDGIVRAKNAGKVVKPVVKKAEPAAGEDRRFSEKPSKLLSESDLWKESEDLEDGLDDDSDEGFDDDFDEGFDDDSGDDFDDDSGDDFDDDFEEDDDLGIDLSGEDFE
jgi:hypothetical protein